MTEVNRLNWPTVTDLGFKKPLDGTDLLGGDQVRIGRGPGQVLTCVTEVLGSCQCLLS